MPDSEDPEFAFAAHDRPARGVRQAGVSLAADALLRAGERPTVEKIRGDARLNSIVC